MPTLTDPRETYRRSEVERQALDGIPLAVAPGGFVAIMGPSGRGESTPPSRAPELGHPRPRRRTNVLRRWQAKPSWSPGDRRLRR